MDWTDWYTDTADVFRNEKVTENSLTHMERRQVLSGVACRLSDKAQRAADEPDCCQHHPDR